MNREIKIIISLSIALSLCPMVKRHQIKGGILTVCHNDVVDIIQTSSLKLYDYGNEKTIVTDNIIFTNVVDYSVVG